MTLPIVCSCCRSWFCHILIMYVKVVFVLTLLWWLFYSEILKKFLWTYSCSSLSLLSSLSSSFYFNFFLFSFTFAFFIRWSSGERLPPSQLSHTDLDWAFSPTLAVIINPQATMQSEAPNHWVSFGNTFQGKGGWKCWKFSLHLNYVGSSVIKHLMNAG